MSASHASAGRKRIRLRPEIRTRQILDAALVEFSRHGFAATRIEDIAHRAGLSKSGVYAHFAGKEAVFEALLAQTLTPVAVPDPVVDAVADPAAIRRRIEDFVDTMYAKLADPAVAATLRLLIVEGGRIPELVRNWRRDALSPYLQRQKQRLRQAAERGCLPCSALTEDFALAHAPAALLVIRMMVFREEGIDACELEALKRSHKRMLLELLRIDDAPAEAKGSRRG